MPSELFLPWISVLSNVFVLASVSIQPLIIDGRHEEEIHEQYRLNPRYMIQYAIKQSGPNSGVVLS